MSRTSLATLAMSWLSLTQANTNFDMAEPPVSLGSKLRRYPNVAEENRNRPPTHVEINKISDLISGASFTKRNEEISATLLRERTLNSTLRRRHAGMVPQRGWGEKAWNDMGTDCL
eukprot:668625-Rhodomonas_salina.3